MDNFIWEFDYFTGFGKSIEKHGDLERYQVWKNNDSTLLEVEIETYGQYSYEGKQLFGDLQAMINFMNFIRKI